MNQLKQKKKQLITKKRQEIKIQEQINTHKIASQTLFSST